MNPFRYERADSVAAALAALERDRRAQVIAGGTNVLDLMKVEVLQPTALVDINRLPLTQIEWHGDVLYLGALARMNEVAASPLVRQAFGMVSSALEQSASPQLRNMASLGGNLLQRTRCPYFRDVATPCNKRAPGSGCGARGGENRMEAVLGTSTDCIATHASDVAVPFMALDATVHVAGGSGAREISLADFYRLPGATPHIEHALSPGELITGISIPRLSFAARSIYLKVRDRTQFEFALASAAVALDLRAGRFQAARVALGGVATVPWRAHAAERALTGEAATRAVFQRAAQAALAGARGYGKNDFKIALAARTLVRALALAAS